MIGGIVGTQLPPDYAKMVEQPGQFIGAPPTPKPSVNEAVHGLDPVIEHIAQMTNKLSAIVGRVVGPRPEKQPTPLSNPENGGLISALHLRRSVLCEIANQLENAVQELDVSL
jgi:hypothetical protein